MGTYQEVEIFPLDQLSFKGFNDTTVAVQMHITIDTITILYFGFFYFFGHITCIMVFLFFFFYFSRFIQFIEAC
jgi:hypothetical protein